MSVNPRPLGDTEAPTLQLQQSFAKLAAEAEECLVRHGAKQGDTYDLRPLLLNDRQAAVGLAFARIMADRLRADPLVQTSHYDCVVGLRRGGDRLAQFLVVNLEKQSRRKFTSAFVSKDENTNEYFGTDMLKHKVERHRVLFVDHHLTTGDTVRKGMDIVRSYGGDIVALAIALNRCPKTAEDLGVPHLISLLRP